MPLLRFYQTGEGGARSLLRKSLLLLCLESLLELVKAVALAVLRLHHGIELFVTATTQCLRVDWTRGVQGIALLVLLLRLSLLQVSHRGLHNLDATAFRWSLVVRVFAKARSYHLILKVVEGISFKRGGLAPSL